MHACVRAESMPPTGGLVETLPVGACNFLLRETVKSRRILDENALARDFIRHPLGQRSKSTASFAFSFSFWVGCGQSLAHTILSGAALTYACATLLVSA